MKKNIKIALVKQSKVLLFDTLLAHAKRDVVLFAAPVIKNGRSIDRELKDYAGEEIYRFDATVFDEAETLCADPG
jgi:arginine/lysine/ornithine decarboxylase